MISNYVSKIGKVLTVLAIPGLLMGEYDSGSNRYIVEQERRRTQERPATISGVVNYPLDRRNELVDLRLDLKEE